MSTKRCQNCSYFKTLHEKSGQCAFINDIIQYRFAYESTDNGQNKTPIVKSYMVCDNHKYRVFESVHDESIMPIGDHAGKQMCEIPANYLLNNYHIFNSGIKEYIDKARNILEEEINEESNS